MENQKIPSSEKTLFLHFYNWTQNKKTPKKSSTQKYLLQRKHLQFDTKKENLKKSTKKWKTKKIPSSEETLFLHFYNWTQKWKITPHKFSFFEEKNSFLQLFSWFREEEGFRKYFLRADDLL